MAELSSLQRHFLGILNGEPTMARIGRNATYNPRLSEMRTFESLERRGLAEWYQGADTHDGPNGYRITDAGRAALRQHPKETSNE